MGANNFDRRDFLITGCAVAAFAATPLAAATSSDAEKLITRLTKDINKSIEARSSDAALFVQFEKIFRKYADVSTISRYALGADARSATKKQLSEFGDVFVTYIARKYGSYFKDFIGGEITVLGSRVVKKYFEVKTFTKLRGQEPMEVLFHVSDRSGSLLLFNLYVEGVSMLLSERNEIGSMLD
ncbi:MAG: ABC transporter substrate-binding protein, partial [Rhodobacteraceae bacterium]|nr:ABC transporter substrate-binding protein [Paracoccaceae bacterium]